MKKVGVIMGSDSDLPVMRESVKILERFGLAVELDIISAHRTPDRALTYAKTAKDRGLSVIIAGAGGAAHLPGVIAAFTALPVIGVPIKSATLNGLDSLYSIVQMPAGIPVATVAINGALNAGILAAEIIGCSDDGVYRSVMAYKSELAESVTKKAERLAETGCDNYIPL